MNKMKNKHIKDFFLDWYELKLNNRKMEMIERHLDDCNECRLYYDKIQNILNNPDTTKIPNLQPDLFLPTKIKELAKQKDNKDGFYEFFKNRIQISCGVVTIIFALTIGIFLGKWMSSTNGVTEVEIVSSYSSMFSNEGIGQVWENIVIEQ